MNNYYAFLVIEENRRKEIEARAIRAALVEKRYDEKRPIFRRVRAEQHKLLADG